MSGDQPTRAGEAPEPRVERRSAAARLWPYLLVGFLYFATSPYHRGLNNPNEMVRVYMTKAIVDDGTFAIDKVIRQWGGVDDKARRDGKLYSSKAPLQSLLGVPVYTAAAKTEWGRSLSRRGVTTVLRRATSVIPGILFFCVLMFWLRRRGRELNLPESIINATGLSLGLGTMLYPYALIFAGHLIAALAAGGTYLGVITLSRNTPGTKRWRGFVIVIGFLAGATPFAEYPAALVALPALACALYLTPGKRLKLQLIGLLALGGALPFGVGLYAHHQAWGSPFATGYAFLENQSYAELHGGGFFGVGLPKPSAFFGAVFAPATGLLFFSPVLALGFVGLYRGARRTPNEGGLARPLAIAAIVGILLELLFISGHSYWRGGWTVGPRYIIPVAPLLGIWALEALRDPRLRPWLAGLGAASVIATGFAAALYPHLSDVYTNPLRTFLLPSYLRGMPSYGIAHGLGLSGPVGNLLHVIPLCFAAAYVLTSPRRKTGLSIAAGLVGAFLLLVAVVPEKDPAAAAAENDRLFGFWEPRFVPEAERGRAFYGFEQWRSISVELEDRNGKRRRCRRQAGVNDRCFYGDHPWQHFGPERMEIGGALEPVLFTHPATGQTVRARVPLGRKATRAVLRYGLSDPATRSQNKTPIDLTVRVDDRVVKTDRLSNDRPGLEELELTFSSTATALFVELRCKQDGDRVMGWNVELFED